MLTAPNLRVFEWLIHGFGDRDTVYPPGIATVKQIHSAIVVEVTAEAQGEADALITDEPGCIVGVKTADCVPVLIACSRTRAVAAVHAGWRGTAQNIVSACVERMIARYGVNARDLHAAVGPGIGRCCYEVGPEVARRFDPWVNETTRLNLPEINRIQLETLNIASIWLAGECTSCHTDRFFSFRREKERAGRMLSFIGPR